MSSKAEKHRKIWEMYRKAGNKLPVSRQALAEWAVRMRLYTPEPEDVIDHLANELGEFLRAEHHIDKKGRKVRSNLAVPTLDGIKWGDFTLPKAQIEAAFKHRRHLIVGDCWQLKSCVDSYNEEHPNDPQIRIPFDFSPDMAELERERLIEKRKGVARSRKSKSRGQSDQPHVPSGAH